jgi:hypothetical protein
MKKISKRIWIVLFLFFGSCRLSNEAISQVSLVEIPVSTKQYQEFAVLTVEKTEPVEIPTVKETLTATVIPTLVYEADWRDWPVIPEEISYSMKVLYKEGLAADNNPHRFSKIGDCQNVPSYFLGRFDREGSYTLRDDQTSLEETIAWYSDSWSRFPPSVHGGQNIAAVQIKNPLISFDNNGQEECLTTESYLDCELRLWSPSIALVSFEELWTGDTTKYSVNYERLIVSLLDKKVVPLLIMTSANEEANEVIAKLAVRFQLPVLNLWSGLQMLPGKGIADGFHLTFYGDTFNFTEDRFSGWHVRNLVSLQAIDALRLFLEAP